MLDKLLSSLQGIPAYSILISAVVVIFIAVSVLVMFGTARQEKEIEQLRWEKVSAHMALYDTSRRVVIPLEADEILIGRHGAADIRFTDMSVSRYHAVLYVSNGVEHHGSGFQIRNICQRQADSFAGQTQRHGRDSVWNKISDNPAAKEETECIKTDSLMENAPQLSC